jgi:hypothetical protein
MYYRLRASGSNTQDAKSNCKLVPEKLMPIIYQYLRWANQIQQNHLQRGQHVDIEYIQWGMAHSHHGQNDWEMISKFSGLKKRRPPRKPKRPKQYEH